MTARVVGGFSANRSTTRWFLQFSLQSPDGGSLCGATAINRRWAVTAAHCVISPSGRIKIGVGGSAFIVNPAIRNQGPRYYIQRVLVHPGYRANSQEHFNDVAVVQTLKPMPVVPIPLNTDPNKPSLNAPESVFGFGEQVAGDSGSLPAVLKQGNVFDLAGPTQGCGLYGSSYNRRFQICAGLTAGGVDACYGDSGGPLTSVVAGRQRLVGIVSSGMDCALSDYPGLYTRVSTYAPWIKKLTSGQFFINPTCGLPSCNLNRGGTFRIGYTNVSTTKGAFAVGGGSGLVVVSPRSGAVNPGRTRVVTVRVTTPVSRCIVLNATATYTPAKRVVIAANGKTGCH